ncbi:MAG: DUF2937 family protein [Thermodesulfobacteriota bacterium]
MSIVHRYLMIFIFGACMILGIQIPNFVDQYEKRIDAHYIEVVQNFRGFQEIANHYYGGNIEALIRKHKTSSDETFQAEGKPIEQMYKRILQFEREKASLDTTYPKKAIHVLVNGDREVIEETYSNYSAGIILDKSAILSGILVSIATCFLLELILILGKRIIRLNKSLERTG